MLRSILRKPGYFLLHLVKIIQNNLANINKKYEHKNIPKSSNKVCICFIGTNNYFDFFDKYYRSAKENFLTDCNLTFLLFTDKKAKTKKDVKFYKIKHIKWPYITLYRFKFIKLAEEVIKINDWFVFVDADMFFNKQIKAKEFFNDTKELFGVQHPALLYSNKAFEYNKDSLAAIDPLIHDTSIYWQGCLWGGKTESVIKMVNELDVRIDKDLANGIIALWHDESHINKYFIENKDRVHTLDSGFAYPEKWILPYRKKIIHVEKNDSLYQL